MYRSHFSLLQTNHRFLHAGFYSNLYFFLLNCTCTLFLLHIHKEPCHLLKIFRKDFSNSLSTCFIFTSQSIPVPCDGRLYFIVLAHCVVDNFIFNLLIPLLTKVVEDKACINDILKIWHFYIHFSPKDPKPPFQPSKCSFDCYSS